jgi:hypothetical protein
LKNEPLKRLHHIESRYNDSGEIKAILHATQPKDETASSGEVECFSFNPFNQKSTVLI